MLGLVRVGVRVRVRLTLRLMLSIELNLEVGLGLDLDLVELGHNDRGMLMIQNIADISKLRPGTFVLGA